MSDSQLAERPSSVKDYLALPAYKDRFQEVLGKRANQFMAAIVASSQLPSLKDAEPRSVIAAAMVAATLDLPVNPTLGQAHIVAYQGVAQFQIGYKGIIQLALRSGQYKRLNAGPVSAGVFAGYDAVGEPVLDFSKNDPVAESAGYYCAFETLNGFLKVVYWSKAQAEAHAKRFSKAYAKGYSTPWKSDFDSMATKTVIKAALGKWGLLSVEMQKAVVHDQGAQMDVDTEVKYVDADEPAATVTEAAPDRPAPKPRSAKGASTVRENAPKVVDAVVEPVVEATPEAAPAPAKVESFTQAAEVVAAEPAKKVEAPANPPANTEPTPAKAMLADGEAMEVTANVESFKTEIAKRNGADWPYVKARVTSPQFAGDVSMTDNALVDGKPIAAWQLDRPVVLKLRGKRYKSGALITLVESITEAKPVTVSEPDEF